MVSPATDEKKKQIQPAPVYSTTNLRALTYQEIRHRIEQILAENPIIAIDAKGFGNIIDADPGDVQVVLDRMGKKRFCRKVGDGPSAYYYFCPKQGQKHHN